MIPSRDISNDSFSQMYQNKLFFYFILSAASLLVILKLPMARLYYETVSTLITFAPLMVVAVMAILAYWNSRKYPDYQTVIRKFYLLFTLKILATILLFYIFYSPSLFIVPLKAFFQYLQALLTLESVFFFLSYLSTLVIAISSIFIAFRAYQKSQGRYAGSIQALTRKTLYALFAFFFLIFTSSAAAYPASYQPITDTLGDTLYTLSSGTVKIFKGDNDQNYAKIESLGSFANRLSKSILQTTQNISISNQEFKESLIIASAELKNSIIQSSEDLSEKIKTDLSGKVDTIGGEITGDLTLTGNDSDLTVEGTTTTRDIVPDDNLSYNLGKSDKSWNNIYVHRLIGASPIFVGNNNSQKGLTKTGDLVISQDAEIQGTLYASTLTIAGAYTLPNTDGTANQVLTTNGDGTMSWTEGTMPGGTTGQIQFNNGGVFSADADLFWDNTNKRLGIGSSAPATELEVSGTAKATAFMLPGGIYLNADSVSTNYWMETDGNVYRETGNIGLGNNSPQERLDIDGRFRMRQTAAPVDPTDRLYNTGGNLYWSGLRLVGEAANGNMAVSGTMSAVNFFDTANGAYLTPGSVNANWWGESGGNIYRETGDVSLGTTNAGGYRLYVDGNIYGNGSLELAGNFNVNSGKLFVDATIGNVGIGTISPTSRLHGVTTLSADTGDEVAYELDYTTNKLTSGNDTGLKINMTDTASPGTSLPLDIQVGGVSKFSVNNSGTVTLAGNFNVNSGKLFVDATTGNVGVGTASPGAKLDVSGNININNTSAYLYDSANALKLVGSTGYYHSTIVGQGGSSATQQTVVGYHAGSSGTGIYQTAIGYAAGQSNTGAYQSALGNWAGRENTGTYQVALGDYAGYQNSGNYVIGIGESATRGNTANNVVAIGYQAGYQNTLTNQFIVKQANINSVPLIQGDFATGNVGIGTTTPSAKLDIYQGSLNLDNTTFANQYGIITKGGTRFIHNFNYGNNGTVTTDGFNTFVGEEAGNLTMGSTATLTGHSSYNTAIGYQAGYDNTIGQSNSFLGYQAGTNNTTGSWNTAVGNVALAANTTGKDNVAIGHASLNSNTSGQDNVAIGYMSMRYNTTGAHNTSLGYSSLTANTVGQSNTALGRESLRFNTSGNWNTASGYQAGYGVSTLSNISGNSLFGYKAGYGLLTGGDNNLLLGYQAGDNITTGSNNIMIGYDVDAVSATGNNQLNIGNTLYGDLSTHDLAFGNDSDKFFWGASQDASITYDGTNFVFNSQEVGVGNFVFNNGNVGIGTANIYGKLNISGAPVASANYGTMSLGGGTFDGSTIGKFSGNISGTSLAINEISGYAGNLIDLQVNGSSQFKVAFNGYLTTGTVVANSFGNPLTNGYSSYKGTSNTGRGSELIMYADQHATVPGGWSLLGDNPYSDVAPGLGTISGVPAKTTAVTNLVGGSVKIIGGEGASASAGLANGGDILLDGGIGYGTGTNGNILLGTINSGNVGIGTTTPTNGKFEVSGGDGLYDQVAAYFDNPGGSTRVRINSASSEAWLEFLYNGGSVGNIRSYGATSPLQIRSAYGVQIANPVSPYNIMATFLSTGNVGIGTTTPTSRLHGVTTLSADTGDEVAYELDYTTNKLTSGNDTGLLINMTDTASPGTSNLIEAKSNGTSRFAINNLGVVSLSGSLILNGGAIIPQVYTQQLEIRGGHTNTSGGIKLTSMATDANTTGSRYAVGIIKTYNQTSGTASNTDLLINRTETAVGSGSQYLIDAQVGGTSKFAIDNTGTISASGNVILTTGNKLILDNASDAAKPTYVTSSNSGYDINFYNRYSANNQMKLSNSGLYFTGSTGIGFRVDGSLNGGTSTYNALIRPASADPIVLNGNAGTQPLWITSVYGGAYTTNARHATDVNISLGHGGNPPSGTTTGGNAGNLNIYVKSGGTGFGGAADGSNGGVNIIGGAYSTTSGEIKVLNITPTYNQVSGTAANTDLLINRTETAVGSGTQLLIDAQVGGASKFAIDNTGNLTAAGSTITLSALADGSLSIVGGVITSSSDERKKDKVTDMDSVLEKVLKLDPLIYTWKDSTPEGQAAGNKEQIGFFAQDMEKHFPQLVGTNDAGMKGLNYNGYTAVLTKAIQEQQASIEAISNSEFLISNQFQIINDQIGVQTRLIASLQDNADVQTQDIASLRDLTDILQAQVAELQSQIATPVDIAQIDLNTQDISYLKTLLGLDPENPGDITLTGQLSVDGIGTGKLTIKVIDTESPTIGTEVIKAGEAETTVSTKAITGDSKIFVAPVANDPVAWAISEKKEGESFTIKLGAPSGSDISFDWWIVEAK